MLNLETIKKVVNASEYEFYGLRVDEHKYNIGETASPSHQLFQDPDFDEEGNPIYPHIEEGIYKGYYDAGELNGTSTIGFDAEDDTSIQKAIDQIAVYLGSYIHVVGGDHAEGGEDRGELIIPDAKILLSIERGE